MIRCRYGHFNVTFAWLQMMVLTARAAMSVFKRDRSETSQGTYDPSLPDGHGSLSILLTRPAGLLAPFWQDGIAQVSIDSADPQTVEWGLVRFVLATGPHHLRVHVTIPFPELTAPSGVANRQLIITEKTELAVTYVSGQIKNRKPSARRTT